MVEFLESISYWFLGYHSIVAGIVFFIIGLMWCLVALSVVLVLVEMSYKKINDLLKKGVRTH